MEAERLSSADLSVTFSKLQAELEQLQNYPGDEDNTESLGLILFLLTNVSKQLNINVAAALQQAINDFKIDAME